MLNNSAEAVVTITVTLPYKRSDAKDYGIDATDVATLTMTELAKRMLAVDIEEFGDIMGVANEVEADYKEVLTQWYEVDDAEETTA